jgi:ParB family chromosome partitioning protein
MNDKQVQTISIAQIRIVNPRTRNKLKFAEIVESIREQGLKRPITVSRRRSEVDGTEYDLVCGQGRIEAFLRLGHTEIPALVIEATQQKCHLMSLIENMARLPPTHYDLLREVAVLKGQGCSTTEIARRVGLHRTYILGVSRLVEQGEEGLLKHVESGRLPISVAVKIATSDSDEVQKALCEAYDSGALRGARLSAAKRIIAQRMSKASISAEDSRLRRKLNGESLVKEYRRHTEQQQALVRRGEQAHRQLTFLVSALKTLLAEDHFATLLRAEHLTTLPETIADLIK